jgi:hypothetical protein
MGGFQTSVNYNPAFGVEGAFASTNPRAVVNAGAGGLIAGDNGAIVGRFAWTTDEFIDFDGAPAVVNCFGAGAIAGFVANEQQALIEVYLGQSSLLVPQGFPVTLFKEGDFWVKNRGATTAVPGQKVYANFADGGATAQATGAPLAGGTSTASTIAAETASFTASIANNVMTVTGAVTGTIYPGSAISGTNVASGTTIIEQLSGTIGGDGTYAVSIAEQTVAATTITATYGLLTVGGTVAGTFGLGDTVSGSGVTAGTTITALGTGTGGAGTYIVNLTQTVGSEAINVGVSQFETKWIVQNTAAPGELIKMSSWPQG